MNQILLTFSLITALDLSLPPFLSQQARIQINALLQLSHLILITILGSSEKLRNFPNGQINSKLLRRIWT